MRLIASLIVLMAALGGPVAAGTAQSQQHLYTIKVRGLPVGTLSLALEATARSYAAAARVESTGLAAIVRSFHFAGTSRGALDGGRPAPARYEETADTGRRQSRAVMVYKDGAPSVVEYASTSPWGADSPDPSTQDDALDPATALFSLFRAQEVGRTCGRTLVMFDGRRRSHVRLGDARSEGGETVCEGEYRRLAGFTPEELSRHVAFPMRVVLTTGPDGLARIERVEVRSVYGLATLHRR